MAELPPSHLSEIKQNQPELTIFKIQATFGQKRYFSRMPFEYYKFNANPFLHIPSVLALECNLNVVGIQ